MKTLFSLSITMMLSLSLYGVETNNAKFNLVDTVPSLKTKNEIMFYTLYDTDGISLDKMITNASQERYKTLSKIYNITFNRQFVVDSFIVFFVNLLYMIIDNILIFIAILFLIWLYPIYKSFQLIEYNDDDSKSSLIFAKSLQYFILIFAISVIAFLIYNFIGDIFLLLKVIFFIAILLPMLILLLFGLVFEISNYKFNLYPEGLFDNLLVDLIKYKVDTLGLDIDIDTNFVLFIIKIIILIAATDKIIKMSSYLYFKYIDKKGKELYKRGVLFSIHLVLISSMYLVLFNTNSQKTDKLKTIMNKVYLNYKAKVEL